MCVCLCPVLSLCAASLFHFIYHQALHVVKDGRDHHLTQVLLTDRAVTVRWLDGHFLITEDGPSWIVHAPFHLTQVLTDLGCRQPP